MYLKNDENKISGRIESIIYHNEKNDYTVFEISDGEDNLITCVGTMPIAFEGEQVLLKGHFIYHKEFGRQFEFTGFEKHLPDDEEGILQYLSSRTVKGVGPVTALKIVNRFGNEAFDVIENHPEWLTDIPGITMKKAAIISKSFREQSEMRGVMMFCKDFLETSEVTRVYKSFGSGAVGLIKENPYILCDEPCSLPFSKVDSIASSIGYDLNSDNRVLSGIKSVLYKSAEMQGHTCLPIETLLTLLVDTLSIKRELATAVTHKLIEIDELAYYRQNGQTFIMTNKVASCENDIAKKIFEISELPANFINADVARLIEKAEINAGVIYAEAQRNALYEALMRGMLILTGGPGTGKTTVVKALVSMFSSIGIKTVLAAPTGRAAKRMSEATGEEAKTIHRMLEMEKEDSGKILFGRNERNPISEKAIIIDEASMVDLELFAALMRAIRYGTRLILIGDTDQLPSVGAGNVLLDLIKTEKIKTIRLTEIFRQSGESMIVTNAHRINFGENPILNSTDGDFFFVGRMAEGDIPSTVASLIIDRLPRKYGVSAKNDIQVITPSKKGCGGVDALNSELQQSINPPGKFKKEKSAHGVTFREGDKVMQIANNYEIEWKKNGVQGMGIFNGDIGVIESIDCQNESFVICFDDKTVRYPFDLLEELELAYAITVHKSQGSEYPIVVIPMYSCPSVLKTRNLLYTAVTRAKNMVVMVGNPEVVLEMMNNNRELLRYTTLKDKICDYY